MGLQIARGLFGLRIAIDTGGTFTDCVYLDAGKLHVLKVRSTPDNPANAVSECLRKIGKLSKLELRHGTTVGTNAMLERKGARVAFVTTAGFEDTRSRSAARRGLSSTTCRVRVQLAWFQNHFDSASANG